MSSSLCLLTRLRSISFWPARILMTALAGLALAITTQPASAQKPSAAEAEMASADDQVFRDIYRSFYDTYRLGAADEIAIRVLGHPDYTVERAKISPIGMIYHPLLGDLEVTGLTVAQLNARLTKELNEYLINPKVSVALLEANSAKIGVIGDVPHPGILVMNKPMNVLEAITVSGGIADTGSKNGVTVLRQLPNGSSQMLNVNLKRILEGKSRPEENIVLQAGDTVIVPGNAKKKLAYVMSLTGFGNFLFFISARGR